MGDMIDGDRVFGAAIRLLAHLCAVAGLTLLVVIALGLGLDWLVDQIPR